MKKFLLTAIIVFSVALTATSLTMADDTPTAQGTFQNGFVDANGDGVCDMTGVSRGLKARLAYQEAGTFGPNFVDEDGDGVCDNCDGTPNLYRYQNQNNMMTGPGPNFVDEDGDGICDNCDGTPNLYRYQNQNSTMTGPGPNFVDEDGDGICDNCALHQYDHDFEYQSPGPHGGRMNGNGQGGNAGNR